MNTYFKISLFYIGLLISQAVACNSTDIEENNNVLSVVHSIKLPFIIKLWFSFEALRLVLG
jgi:hypothetical protein